MAGTESAGEDKAPAKKARTAKMAAPNKIKASRGM